MSEDTHVQHSYKDSVFRDLFSRRKYAISLYNALTDEELQDTPNFEIITLKNVLCVGGIRHDLALCTGDCITLIEHQSTHNPNMPFRSYSYMDGLFNYWYHQQRSKAAQLKTEGESARVIDIFSSTLIQFPLR